jgi:hypothetical protein
VLVARESEGGRGPEARGRWPEVSPRPDVAGALQARPPGRGGAGAGALLRAGGWGLRAVAGRLTSSPRGWPCRPWPVRVWPYPAATLGAARAGPATGGWVGARPPPPGVTSVLGLPSLGFLSLVAGLEVEGPGAAGTGAEPGHLAEFPERRRRSRCQCNNRLVQKRRPPGLTVLDAARAERTDLGSLSGGSPTVRLGSSLGPLAPGIREDGP